MANNRLYILDTETNECIMLAKGFAMWGCTTTEADLDRWFEARDMGAAQDCCPTKLKLITEDELHKMSGVKLCRSPGWWKLHYPDQKPPWKPSEPAQG